MPEFDRNRVVGSFDCNDPDLELRVDPSKACFRSGVVGERYELSSMAVPGGVDMLGPLLCIGEIGDADDSACSVKFWAVVSDARKSCRTFPSRLTEVSRVILIPMGFGDERPSMMADA